MWEIAAAFILGMFAMVGLMFWLSAKTDLEGNERVSKEPNWLDDPVPKKRKKRAPDMDELGVQITKDGMKAGQVKYSKKSPFKVAKKRTKRGQKHSPLAKK